MGTGHRAAALPAQDTRNWVEAHAALSRLARERAALDAEEGCWLLCALRSAAHVHLGFGSFAEYIERLFGYKPRTTQEKLRVAEALELLPHVARALESGAVSWCAARELTRVVVPDTEQAWLDAARGKTQRELEALVASKNPGDAPDAGGTEPPRPRVLRFDVAPDTFATFREAMQRLQHAAGGHLDDDAVLLAMARHVLGGPEDTGRSSYQISLSVCSACGGGALLAGGELVPVDAAIVSMAACDAQHLGEVLPRASVPPAAVPRAASDNADRYLHASESTTTKNIAARRCSNHAHVGASRAVKKQADRCLRDNTAESTSEEMAARSDHGHVGVAMSRPENDADTKATVTTISANDGATATSADVRRPARARQNIPPALRRAVLARDRRCRVTGCTHATFVDVHHLQPRSEGGRNEASNLLTLCSAHHRATHAGELLIERGRDGSVRFWHADGSPYGTPAAPQHIDARAKVFSALRHLGFREGEVKAVLAELHADAALAGAPVERLLREALCRIKPRAR